jgi:hypothetical protein
MYIVNEHGIPDDWHMPDGARLASEHEIATFLATGQQHVALMPPAAPLAAEPVPLAAPAKAKK